MRNAARIAIRKPNSRNATKIESSVKSVRDLPAPAGCARPAAGTSCRHSAAPGCPSRGAASACARSAACGSWVTMTMVLPCSRLSVCSRSRISSPDLRSRSPVGSSQSSSVGIGDDGAGDADALFLAARQLARVVVRAIGQADHLQRDLRRACGARPCRQLRQQQRQLDVALGGQHRQQVVELEDEADVVARASAASWPPDELVDAHAADLDGAGGRRVEPADQVEQRRLAGARRSHQGQEVALGDVEVDALQHVDALAAAACRTCGRPRMRTSAPMSCPD